MQDEAKETSITRVGYAAREAPGAHSFNLVPQSMTEAIEFSKIIAASELCPKEYQGKYQSVMIAMMMGAELGITTMQSLQNIAVINGRPSMWGDLVIGLVYASKILASINERDPQECSKKDEGRCEVLRKGQPESVVRTYSYQMAIDAGLIKRAREDMPWRTNKGRMLQMRARAWALRDTFPDVLKGLQIREEVDDYPPAPEPISMPRRASESSPAVVEAFIKDGQQAPAAAPAAAQQMWHGRVEKVTSREGKSKGRKWTLYLVKCADGMEFGTFESGQATFAEEAAENQIEVRISWEMTPKGSKKILIIEPDTVAEAEADVDTDPDV